MKNVILALTLICASFSAFAQGTIDVKISPLGLIFGGNIDVSGEYAISETFGIEAGLRPGFGGFDLGEVAFKQRGLGGYVAGRYYFNPEKGADKFNAGVYVRGRSTSYEAEALDQIDENFSWNRVAAGLLVGQKWVGDNGLVFELDLGVGRAFTNNFKYDDENRGDSFNTGDIPLLNTDVLTRVAIGYRFGGTK